MTEILDYANSVATSKEEIRQAMVARGVECDQSVPLSEYANKINNMVVSGNVDNIQGLNCTGHKIFAGEKVFFKKNVYTGSSKTRVYNTPTSSSSPNTEYFINPDGTKVFYENYVYDINSGDINSTNFDISNSGITDSHQVYYDTYGNMFVGKYLLNESPTYYDWYFSENNYAWEYNSSDREIHLYRINKSDFTIEKSWTIPTSYSSSSYPTGLCIFGNKIYHGIYTSSQSYYLVAILDENSDTIVSDDTKHYNLAPVHSTSDNKIAICSKNDSSSSMIHGLRWYQIKFVNIDENYDLGEEFITSNADLSNLQNLLNNYVIFNRNTDTLFIGSSNSDTYYGIFKWNTELNDFETITVNLKNFERQYGKLITASTDLSKIQVSNYLYGLEQNSEGYKVIDYHSQIGDDILTGVALTTAANGEVLNIKTILPSK